MALPTQRYPADQGDRNTWGAILRAFWGRLVDLTTGQWKPGVIPGSALESGTITETQLGDNTVTNAKIQNDSITTAKLAAGAVTDAKVAADAAIAQSKIANLEGDLAAKVTNPLTTPGDLIVGGAGGVPTRVAGGAVSSVLRRTAAGTVWGPDVAHPFDYIPANQHAAILNGTTDYDATADLQDMFDEARAFRIPDGTYLINAVGNVADEGGSGGVAPRSNSVLWLGPNTVLKAIGNSSDFSVVLRLDGVSNVQIFGGTIQGERASHIGGTGEHGHAIGIWGGSDIWLWGVTTKDAWGDGVMIRSSNLHMPRTSPARIHLIGHRSLNNRRNNLAAMDFDGLYILGGEFSGANGTAPQSGIDIEPGSFGVARHLALVGAVVRDNLGPGVAIGSNDATSITDGVVTDLKALNNGTAGLSVSGPVSAVTIANLIARGNGTNNLSFAQTPSGRPTFIVVRGGVLRESGQHGVWFENIDDSLLEGVTIIASGQSADNTYDGILFQGTPTRNRIRGNTIRRGGGANQTRRGINVLVGMDNIIEDNDLRTAGKTEPMRIDALATGTIQRGNLLDDAFRTFTSGDTTPSVERGSLFKTANVNPTTITTFDQGYAGQEITIVFTDANTTIGETGNIKLSAAFTSSADDTMRLVFDGTNWYELSRSVN